VPDVPFRSQQLSFYVLSAQPLRLCASAASLTPKPNRKSLRRRDGAERCIEALRRDAYSPDSLARRLDLDPDLEELPDHLDVGSRVPRQR
jgi:hypothetical protein